MSDVTLTIDGDEATVPAGTTILEACGGRGCGIPTLCYGDTITPKNACRVCMVEVEGSRVLVPSCSRKVEPGMVVTTRSERVDHSRKMVLEFLGSSVDLSLTEHIEQWNAEYGADPGRYGADAASVAQPVKVDNDLYVRDYAKCILCWRCVQVCAEDAQYTFALSFDGRGFETQIGTFFGQPMPETTCVFCGQCVGVCPTGALKPRREWLLQEGKTPDEIMQLTRSERKRRKPRLERG